MTRRVNAPLLPIALHADGETLHEQIYDQVRELILSGNLAPGHRLPSSRTLAAELGCARNTVLAAYDQLESEGYLEARPGSGCYVSSVLPEALLHRSGDDRASDAQPLPAPSPLSELGRQLLVTPRRPSGLRQAFAVGVPDVDAFPFEQWGRLLGSVWRRPGALAKERDPAGHWPLRVAIANYLNAARGLRCGAEDIVVTTGSQQAVDLVARLLLEPGDAVWIEDPGYAGFRGPLGANGLELVPVPVDEDGLRVEEALARRSGAKLAVVTPSHQYPLGRCLSLSRRLALLEWADAAGGWILEDDYDSEYRYAGRPLAALRGLDAQRGGSRVIYVGSFSKVLFPGLRLGYLVLPRGLSESVARARQALDDHPSTIAQPVLARFLESGQFAAHVRRMRLGYQHRQELLVTAAERHLRGHLRLEPDAAGMHLVAWLAPGLERSVGDVELAARAAEAGVTVAPLSSYYLGKPSMQALLMGYAAVPDAMIEPAVRRLGEVCRAVAVEAGIAPR